MDDSRKIGAAIKFASIIILVSVVIHAFANRYTMTAGYRNAIVRLDRITGKMAICEFDPVNEESDLFMHCID